MNFYLTQGETLGLVGESGCGKTTTGRTILRLIEPTAGEVKIRQDGKLVDITTLSRQELKASRREMQIVFQDPFSSLNPRMSVGDIVGEPLYAQGMRNRRQREDRVIYLLESVGLKSSHMSRYPHEFSGGQRQRIGLARALALDPKLIICDEPVSALDVSVQAQVLNLFEDLQSEFNLTYLFIAHDLSVVEHISDRVAVMYLGKIVEMTTSDNLYYDPKHPYSEALLSAVPIADPDVSRKRILIPGDVPDPSNPPPGCNFHPRCKYAEEICKKDEPSLRDIGTEERHFVACHFAEKLDLAASDEKVYS